MPSGDTKILEFNQKRKSYKMLFVIYAPMESLIKRDGCKNNFKKSPTTKVVEHIPSGYSMSTICAFGGIKNKH